MPSTIKAEVEYHFTGHNRLVVFLSFEFGSCVSKLYVDRSFYGWKGADDGRDTIVSVLFEKF